MIYHTEKLRTFLLIYFIFGVGKSRKCPGYFFFNRYSALVAYNFFSFRFVNSFSISLIACSYPGNWSSSYRLTRKMVSGPTFSSAAIASRPDPAMSRRAMRIRRPSITRSLGVRRSLRNNFIASLPRRLPAAVYRASNVSIRWASVNSFIRIFI